MIVTFKGFSDDLLHIGLNGIDREYGLFEGGIHIADAVLTFGVEKLKVVCLFDRQGNWCFAPSVYDENTPWLRPDECIPYLEHPYCVGLRVQVPDGTQLRVYDTRGEDVTRDGV